MINRILTIKQVAAQIAARSIEKTTKEAELKELDRMKIPYDDKAYEQHIKGQIHTEAQPIWYQHTSREKKRVLVLYTIDKSLPGATELINKFHGEKA